MADRKSVAYTYGVAAQQAHEADTLIEAPIVAAPGFAAFRVMGGVTAKPACGLCAYRLGLPPRENTSE